MANDELYTPKYIFDNLKLIFDLDVCAPEDGPLHTPAVEYFDLNADGLTAKWFGLVWMNPPFSKPSPWVERFIEHNNGVALTPIGGNGRWLNRLWDSDCDVLIMPPNVGFINTQGEEKKIMYRVGLWAAGETAKHALKRSGLGHVR